MSYSVDWIAKVITIPTSDLTLVSGTRYQLPMSLFLIEIRRLESEFAEGLWAPQILDHDNPKLDFAGANYAGFDKVINGYTLQVTGLALRVDLVGSNNNIIDVLIATGVSIVPSNSAGLQLVSVGSGLSTEEHDKLIGLPQEDTIAVTTWDHELEIGYSAKEMFRIVSAVLAGELSGANIDVDNNTITITSIDGLKTRVTASTDKHGNRTLTILDPS